MKRSQTIKNILDDSRQTKNTQNKNTIQNFEKLLITEQETSNKSSKNFFGPTEIKSGNK